MALAVKFFHLGVLCFYMYTSYHLGTSMTQNKKSDDPNLKLVGKFTFRFLTNWTYGVQLFYFALCTLGHLLDIIPKMSRPRDKVNSFGNLLFTTIVGPIGLLVTTFFWALYIIDRELVFPKWIDQVIPFWINHAIHSLNSVFPIIDMWLVNHKFPSVTFAMQPIAAYLGAYAVCLFGTYFETGRWIYPFFNELTWPQRGIVSIGNFVLSVSFYFILKLISRLIWGTQKVGPAKQSKSKKNARQKSKKSA